MRYKRCKCGAVYIWDSGYPEYPCQGCEKCKTNCTDHPDHHVDLQPHKLERIIYSQTTGKPQYKVCSVCQKLVPITAEAVASPDGEEVGG